jgi:hypothetical protein
VQHGTQSRKEAREHVAHDGVRAVVLILADHRRADLSRAAPRRRITWRMYCSG